MAIPLRLLIGLGNPGSKYQSTRHNAGFWFVDAVASRCGAEFRNNARFFAELAEASVAGRSLRILKPTTYMNESGRAAAAAVRFFRIPLENVLIAHDDIDLPPGAVRLKRGGGHGGHNGLRDIIPAVGGADFARLRIGVGHPGNKDAVEGYVLNKARAEDQALIDSALARALEKIELIVDGNFQQAMNELHRKPADTEGDG